MNGYKKQLIFLIFLILGITNLSLKSQNITVLLLDSLTKKPISDVNIANSQFQTIAISNQEGKFTMIKEQNPFTLSLTHVAYHTRKLTVFPTSENHVEIAITLIPITILLDSVVISADLNNTEQKNLPVFTRTVSQNELIETSSTNIDLFLRKIPGINVNRSWGIFSKNASITMRGLTNSASVLISLDGVPLNKLAGGSVNWNMMSSSSLSRIEVVKGPNSAQYGMNALGGCVNLQGRRPQKKFEGDITLFGGTYKTRSANLYFGGRNSINSLTYYWSLNASSRFGDGYIYFPTNEPSPIAQKTYLEENSILFNSGMIWNPKNITQIGVLYSLDKRGEGIKVYEPEGSYNSYNTNIVWIKHNYTTPKINISLLAFSNMEDYFRQNENVNNSGLYQYYVTNSFKGDRGAKLITNYLPAIKKNTFSGGIEFRQGDVDATDLYYTSTDKISYQGNLIFAGLFLQDDYEITDKFSAKISFRYDWAWFSRGRLRVDEPTPVTLFLLPVNKEFQNKQWSGFSPKLSLSYHFSKSTLLYTSVSKGFLPPKIEDMTKSGKIRKGFKMANPNLYPERLMNYELGLKSSIGKKVEIEAVLYYSKGNDFQYFVSQGDSVDVGGDALLAVLQKTNIANVNIYGTDLMLNWKPSKYFNFMMNYSYNSSKIGSMNSSNPEVMKLSGKYLAEVPAHILGLYSDFSIKGFHLSLSYNYTSDQWYDDENIEIVEAYNLFNAKLSKKIFKNLFAAVSVEDILDSHYIDRKGYLSPGRFILGELRFSF